MSSKHPSAMFSKRQSKQSQMLISDGEISEDDSELSESEIEETVDKVYQQLLKGDLKVKLSETSFRCPFCLGKKKQDYKLKDLHQHANGVGASNKSKPSEKSNHLALAKFLMNDLKNGDSLTPPRQAETPKPVPLNEEKYVFPWMGVLVNKATDRNFVGENLMKEKDYSQFNVRRVIDLLEDGIYIGKSIVFFREEWSGYHDARNFTRWFEDRHSGKGGWRKQKHRDISIYGWLATADDFESCDQVGDYLRQHGALKTVSEVNQELSQEKEKKLADLVYEYDQRNRDLEELKGKYHLTAVSLETLLSQKEQWNQMYNEEMRKMQRDARAHLNKFCRENERQKRELEARRMELEKRSLEMDRKEALIHDENERRKLEEDKKVNLVKNESLQKATAKQQKADENVLKLLENQQRASKQLSEEILQKERELDTRQHLEIDIEQIKGKLEVMKIMGVIEKISELEVELREKEREMGKLEQRNSALLVLERESNDELVEARKVLMAGLEDEVTERTVLIIKRMGELDTKPFLAACKQRLPAAEAEVQAFELSSLWDTYISDPNWYPLKVVGEDDDAKEVIDDDDEKLKDLLEQWGEGVCTAVKTAVLELNEYNPSGRYCVKEIWNKKSNRKATLEEGLEYVIKKWKAQNKKRKKSYV